MCSIRISAVHVHVACNPQPAYISCVYNDRNTIHTQFSEEVECSFGSLQYSRIVGLSKGDESDSQVVVFNVRPGQ